MDNFDDRLIGRALLVASEFHAGQRDKQGQVYLGHLLRVAGQVILRGADSEVICAAILHDSLEDSALTPENLGGLMPAKTSDLVKVLTHSERESYDQYLGRVVAAGPDAILIKVCDVTDNLSRVDMLLPGPDRERLYHKYTNALEKLSV